MDFFHFFFWIICNVLLRLRYLHLQEARALLGRYEYQKGNIEAALHVFEGIDITAVTPKIKQTLARRGERHKRHSQNYATQPMSIHAANLLLEALFLKAKSLQGLGRFKGISSVLIHRFAICFRILRIC